MRKIRYQEDIKIDIKKFLNSLLQCAGYQRGIDYQVFKNHLFIKKDPQRGKILSLLKELYPKYNFYWESPRTLKWF